MTSEDRGCSVGCPYKSRVEALEKDAERNSTQHREFYNLFKDVEVNDAVTKQTYQQILSAIAELKSSMTEMKAVPAKRWESVVTSIISALVGVGIGLILK